MGASPAVGPAHGLAVARTRAGPQSGSSHLSGSHCLCPKWGPLLCGDKVRLSPLPFVSCPAGAQSWLSRPFDNWNEVGQAAWVVNLETSFILSTGEGRWVCLFL